MNISKLTPYLVFLFAALAMPILNGQISQQNTPGLAWSTEFYCDYRFDPVQEKLDFNWNTLDIIKRINLPGPAGFGTCFDCTDYFWRQTAYEWLKDYNLAAYSDPSLSAPLLEEDRNSLIYTIDSIIMIDPNTLVERVSIVVTEIGLSELSGVRVKHIAYYSETDQALHIEAFSFAPLIKNYDDQYVVTNLKPLVWFPVHQAPSFKILFSSDEIDYIFQTKTRDNSPKLENMKSLSGQVDFVGYFEERMEKLDKPAYSIDGTFTPLEKEYLLQFKKPSRAESNTDNDISKAAKSAHMVAGSAFENLGRLQIVANWFVDKNSKRLYFQPVGYAPARYVKDEQGEIQFFVPMFFMQH
jgi:hypothetical protein